MYMYVIVQDVQDWASTSFVNKHLWKQTLLGNKTLMACLKWSRNSKGKQRAKNILQHARLRMIWWLINFFRSNRSNFIERKIGRVPWQNPTAIQKIPSLVQADCEFERFLHLLQRCWWLYWPREICHETIGIRIRYFMQRYTSQHVASTRRKVRSWLS